MAPKDAPIHLNIRGAERLGDVFDIALAEAKTARDAGVPIELSQERGVVEGALVLTVASIVEPYVKEFVLKFLGKIAQNVADRLMAPKPAKIETFVLSINDVRYKLPDDLERLRKEQSLP